MQNADVDTVLEASDRFPTETVGLPDSAAPEVVDLAPDELFELEIAPVVKQLGDVSVRMLAYNGSIPGPTLRVQQGSEIAVTVANAGELEATVHWHGLRVENRYDGTHETQAPMEIGDRFTYRLQFPDPGVYWYHPHIREDYGQEAGLYGNILVVPSDPDYWAPVNREVLVTLDDVLLEDGKIASFSRSETTHVAMGRFGNTMLTAGEPSLELAADLGEVVRFYLTNTANTRVFNVALQGARMKLVGGDSGRFEREAFVDEVMLAPSERAVVDVLFDRPGRVVLEHHHPGRCYTLGTVEVRDEQTASSFAEQFALTRRNPDMLAERDRIAPYLAAAPDKTLAFVAEMNMGAPEGAVVYTSPMHPEIVSADEGSCPQCGMKLLATPVTYSCPMHPEVVSAEEGSCPECGMKLLPSHLVGAPAAAGHHDLPAEGREHGGGEHGHDSAGGIEWEDDMVEVNKMTTPANMRWKIVDRTVDPSGKAPENHAIAWRFTVGDQVKIRLVNEMDSDHPMHHPFHIHGAGRFLVLRRDGSAETNLVWKDTVLVRRGETVDILLDVTNPGIWMAHCHIAEHHESGMMFSFNVEDAE
jgi:FtsP/CotA-like multicopper oxidase with cupredoxin domain